MTSFSAPRRAAFILGVLLTLPAAVSAQHSNGLTFYRLAGPTSTDSSGNVLTGAAAGNLTYQTDGSTVVFVNRTGVSDDSRHCDSNWGLYTTPITGGRITPLVTSATKVEPSEPDGTTASICEQPIVLGGNLFYGADYTPQGGTRRYGFFSIPLAGGTSKDILATGDSTGTLDPSHPTVAAVHNGASLTSTTTQPIGSAAIYNTNSFLGEAVDSSGTQFALQISAASGLPTGAQASKLFCNGINFTINTSSLTYSNAGVYVATANQASPNTGNVILLMGSSLNFTCQSVILDPQQNTIYPTAIPTLPGEPAADRTNYPYPITVMGSPAVSQSTAYFAANQVYGSGVYWGVFAATSQGITKIWSSLDAIPGIDPTIKPCPSATANIFVYTVVSAGDDVVFQAAQNVRDCATGAGSWTGGLYRYSPVTKAITRMIASQTDLYPGDQPYSPATSFMLQPGDLTPDGHLIFSSIQGVDANYHTSSVLYSTYLNQTVTAVSLAGLTPLPYNGTVDLSARVTPNTGQSSSATGSVSFYDGSTLLGTQLIDSTGLATYKAGITALGSHTLSAVYSGDPLYEGATSANSTVTIGNTPTTLTLTASPAGSSIAAGTLLTFTAALTTQASGTPGGFINFADNGKILGPPVLLSAANNAVFTISTLAVGAHSITASYAGDTVFLPSQSSAINVTVGNPDFALTAAPNSVSIASGQSANTTFTLTPAFGFNQAITLACTGLPSNTTCTFAPSTLTPSGTPVTSVLTISTGVKTASSGSPFERFRSTTAAIVAAGLLLIPFAGRRRKPKALIAFLLAFVFGSAIVNITGCSGGSSPSSSTTTTTTATTRAGSYTIMVAATTGTGSSATTHSTPLTVTVN